MARGTVPNPLNRCSLFKFNLGYEQICFSSPSCILRRPRPRRGVPLSYIQGIYSPSPQSPTLISPTSLTAASLTFQPLLPFSVPLTVLPPSPFQTFAPLLWLVMLHTVITSVKHAFVFPFSHRYESTSSATGLPNILAFSCP
jgi:hypothetical protein